MWYSSKWWSENHPINSKDRSSEALHSVPAPLQAKFDRAASRSPSKRDSPVRDARRRKSPGRQFTKPPGRQAEPLPPLLPVASPQQQRPRSRGGAGEAQRPWTTDAGGSAQLGARASSRLAQTPTPSRPATREKDEPRSKFGTGRLKLRSAALLALKKGSVAIADPAELVSRDAAAATSRYATEVLVDAEDKFCILPPEQTWHAFVCHSPATGVDQALNLEQALVSRCAGANLCFRFTAGQELSARAVRQIVPFCDALILILTSGVLARPDVQLAVKLALAQKKRICLLHDTEIDTGGTSLQEIEREGNVFSTNPDNIAKRRASLTPVEITELLARGKIVRFRRGEGFHCSTVPTVARFLDAIPDPKPPEAPAPLYAMLRPKLPHEEGAHLLIIGGTEARDQTAYIKSLLHKFGPDNLKVKMSHDEPDDPEHLASVCRAGVVVLTANLWRTPGAWRCILSLMDAKRHLCLVQDALACRGGVDSFEAFIESAPDEIKNHRDAYGVPHGLFATASSVVRLDRTVEAACPMLDAIMAVGGAVPISSAPPPPCAPPPAPQKMFSGSTRPYCDPALGDAKSHLLGMWPGGEPVSPMPTLLALVGPSGSGKTTVAASLAADDDIHRHFGNKDIHWVRIRGDAPDLAAEIERAQKDLLKALRHHSTRPDTASLNSRPGDGRRTRVAVTGQSPPKEGLAGRADTSPRRGDGEDVAAAAAAIFGRDTPEAAAARGDAGDVEFSPPVSPGRAGPPRHEETAWQSTSDGIKEEMSRQRCLVIVDECPDVHTLETFTSLVPFSSLGRMVLLTSVPEAPEVLDMAALEPWTLHVTPVGPMLPEAAADMMLEAGLRSARASSGASVKLLVAAQDTPGVKEKTAELAFAAGGTPLGIIAAGAALSASLSAAPELSATAMGPFIASACKAISALVEGEPAATAGRPAGRSSTVTVSGRASAVSLATRVMRMDPASRSCRTVAQAMTALGPELAERFRLTGLLFKNTGEPLPQELLATLWQMNDADALATAETFEANGLLSRDVWTGGLCLHAVQQAAAREALPKEESAEYQTMHAELLNRAGEAFRIPPCSKQWTRQWWLLPADHPGGRYFLRNVVKHMDAARQTKEACTLFFELPWLQATIRNRGVDELISDIDERQVVGDEQTWLLAETLRLASPGLRGQEAAEALPGQLCGRIGHLAATELELKQLEKLRGVKKKVVSSDGEETEEEDEERNEDARPDARRGNLWPPSREIRTKGVGTKQNRPSTARADVAEGGSRVPTGADIEDETPQPATDRLRELESDGADRETAGEAAPDGAPAARDGSPAAVNEAEAAVAGSSETDVAVREGEAAAGDSPAGEGKKSSEGAGQGIEAGEASHRSSASAAGAAALDDQSSLRVLEKFSAKLTQWAARAAQRVKEHQAAAHAAAKLMGGARGVSMLLLPGLVRAARRYRGRLPWLRPVRATLHRPDPSDVQLKGHTGSVRTLFMLHDGHVVSCAADKTIRIWESHTHTCISVLAGHTGVVNAVIELPDGRLASGAGDHTVRIWQRATGACDAVFEEHTGSVTALAAVRPAGAVMTTAGTTRIAPTPAKYRRFVSAGCDCLLKVWDANTLLSLNDLRGHTEYVMCVAPVTVSTVISGSWDKTLKLWDIVSGQCVRTMKGHVAGVNAVAVMADGRVVSGGLDRTLRTWDISAGVCERLLEGHQMWITSVYPLQSLGAGVVGSTSRDGCIRIWNVDIGVCDRVIEAHRQSTNALLQLPNGHLLTASEDKSIRVWNLADESSERPIGGHTGAVRVLQLLAYKYDGHIVSGSDDRTLRLWEIVTGYCKRVFQGHRAAVVTVADMGDGRMASGSHDSQVRLWDLGSGICMRTMDGHVARVTAVVAAEGGRIVSGSMDEDIRVWEAATGDVLHTFKEAHKGGVTAVAAAMEGQGFIVSAGKDASVRCWNIVRGQRVDQLQGHRLWVQSVTFLDTGRLVSASMDTTFRVWNLPWQRHNPDDPFASSGSGASPRNHLSGPCESVVRGYGGNPDTIVAFPNAALVVSSASDGTVRPFVKLRCWSLKTGECAAAFESLLGRVRNVSTLPMPGYSPPSSPPGSPPRPASRSSSNLKARLAAAMTAGAVMGKPPPPRHKVTLQPVVFSTDGGFLSGIVPAKKEALRQPGPPVEHSSFPKRPHWEVNRMLQRSRSLAPPVAGGRGAGALESLEEHGPDSRGAAAGGGVPDGFGERDRHTRHDERHRGGNRVSVTIARPGPRQFHPHDDRSPSALPEWGQPLADMYIAPPPVGHVVTVSTRLNITGNVDEDDEEGVGPDATFVVAGSGNGRMHFFKYTQAKGALSGGAARNSSKRR